jgi:septal ring factor EnvC (AmiA/AmiB activator)
MTILSKNILDFANQKQLSIENLNKCLSQSIKHIVSATSSNAVLDSTIKEISNLKKAVKKDHEEIQALKSSRKKFVEQMKNLNMKYSNVFDGMEEIFGQHVADLREVGQDILAAERNCKARAATVLNIVDQENKVLKLRELLNKELEELNVWEEFHYVN